MKTMQRTLWPLWMGLSPVAQAQPDPEFEREALFDSYRAFIDSLEAVAALGEGESNL